jgi:hypothetical protein
MSDAQIVLAFVFGDQTTTLDDKKTALALAKDCPAEVSRIAEAMGMTRGPDGKWARAGPDQAAQFLPSPKVAAQHYLMAREHHFDAVVRGDGVTATEPATPSRDEAADSCSANCSSLVVQNAAQQAPAPDRTEPHETIEPAAAQRVTAGSSEVTPVSKTGQMAGTGFEPVTSRL